VLDIGDRESELCLNLHMLQNKHYEPKCHQKAQACFLPIHYLPVQSSFMLQGEIMIRSCVELFYIYLQEIAQVL